MNEKKPSLMDLTKSFTVRIGTIGFAILAGLIAVPDLAQETLTRLFGLTQEEAKFYIRLTGTIVASLGISGIAIGRRDAPTKPPLSERHHV